MYLPWESTNLVISGDLEKIFMDKKFFRLSCLGTNELRKKRKIEKLPRRNRVIAQASEVQAQLFIFWKVIFLTFIVWPVFSLDATWFIIGNFRTNVRGVGVIRLLKGGLCYTAPRATGYIVFSSLRIEMFGLELGSVSLVKPRFQHRVKLHHCVTLSTQTRHRMSTSICVIW